MTSPNGPQGSPSPQYPSGQYPSGPQYPTQQTPPPQRTASNALAITALVLGIIAFVTGAAPFWGLLVGAAAVVVGIMALLRRQQKPFAIIGIVGGAIGFIASVVTTWLTIVALSAGAAVVSELATTTPTFEFDTPPAVGATPPADAAETEAPADSGESTIVYEVTGDGGPATVSYMTAEGGNASQQQDTAAALPWSTTVTVPEAGSYDYQGFTLVAMAAGDATTITCRITVDGEVVAEQTSTGAYSIASCSASSLD